MQYKIFKKRTNDPDDQKFVNSLSEHFQISYLSALLLYRRGFTSIAKAEEYLYPNETYLCDPYAFSDMKKTVERIRQAREKQEKILIYGDYDCDGVNASVILYKALSEIGCTVSYYLPDRFTDGYGMNVNSVSRLIENGAQLIITVDNGITAVKEIALAKSMGVDVILTDHHTCPEQLPDAYAYLNPKIEGENYPFKDLCGAGIAFKLAQALDIRRDLLYELLIFAAIATVADLVPLTGENRIITSVGLRKLRENMDINPGLYALLQISKLQSGDINSGKVSFQIAPRINAAGRLYNATLAAELFLTQDKDRAQALAKNIDDANEERKGIEKEIVDKCEQFIGERNLLEKQSVLFIRLQDENEGVIGIAAGKLMQQYNRPVVIGCEKDGIVKASARSIPMFNIYDALSQAGDLFVKFGGHAQAAGFSIESDKYEKMVQIVNEYAVSKNIKSLYYKTYAYDVEAVSSQITQKAVEEIELFAPFGIGNPKPVYKLESVNLRNPSKMGSTGEHFRCDVLNPMCNLRAVGFSMGYLMDDKDLEKRSYDMVFTPNINTFRRHTSIQLEIRDLYPSVQCPKPYYESLYRAFYAWRDTEEYTVPEQKRSPLTFEGAIDTFENALFIIYGKDAFIRAYNYSRYKGRKAAFHYNCIDSNEDGDLQFLVNPIMQHPDNIQRNIVVLDSPCYFPYEKKFYENIDNLLFLREEGCMPEIKIDRDYVAFIYKRLKILHSLGYNVYTFINYLNRESEIAVNYFSLRMCLDVMQDIDILEYEINNGQLRISYHKLDGPRDINQSPLMKILQGVRR